MGVAAVSHTHRTSENLSLRRAIGVAAQRDRTSVPGEFAEAELALVYGEGVPAMDITDEADAALKNGYNKERRALREISVGQEPDRLLHLFLNGDNFEKEEENIDQRRFNSDLHTQIFALYEEYEPRLFRYLRSLHLRAEEAEELIQETFTLLTAALLKRTDIENIQGWIVRVAHHLAVDVIKRREREASHIRQISDFEFDSVQDRSSSPEQNTLEREQSRQIEMALERMTPLQRQCFYMRAEGFLNKDIALALGITPQRVGAVIKKVVVRLAVICG